MNELTFSNHAPVGDVINHGNIVHVIKPKGRHHNKNWKQGKTTVSNDDIVMLFQGQAFFMHPNSDSSFSISGCPIPLNAVADFLNKRNKYGRGDDCYETDGDIQMEAAPFISISDHEGYLPPVPQLMQAAAAPLMMANTAHTQPARMVMVKTAAPPSHFQPGAYQGQLPPQQIKQRIPVQQHHVQPPILPPPHRPQPGPHHVFVPVNVGRATLTPVPSYNSYSFPSYNGFAARQNGNGSM